MTCPKCGGFASGLMCQRCGFGLMTAELTSETSLKSVPEADVAGKIKVSVAAISSKYEAIIAHQSEAAAEAYGVLQGELKSLQEEYDAAKAELVTVTAELAALKGATEQK